MHDFLTSGDLEDLFIGYEDPLYLSDPVEPTKTEDKPENSDDQNIDTNKADSSDTVIPVPKPRTDTKESMSAHEQLEKSKEHFDPNKKTLVVIDADSIIWLIAWKYKDKSKIAVKTAVSSRISKILAYTNADKYIGFYATAREGKIPHFRYALINNYKANRPDTPEWVTKWRPLIHEVMRDTFHFHGIEGIEVDDAVSLAVETYRDEYNIIVASPDKDLRQIPNVVNFNYSKFTFEYIDEFEAARSLATQMLTGDTSDNVKGLPNIGPKKAANILKDCTTPKCLLFRVIRQYINHHNTVVRSASTELKKTIVEEVEDYLDEEGVALSEDQKNRLIRIKLKEALEKSGNLLITNWKAYLKQQYQLLHMLTDFNQLESNFELVENADEVMNSDSVNVVVYNKTIFDNPYFDMKPSVTPEDILNQL